MPEAEDEGGCRIDWGWMAGQEISAVRSNLDTLEIDLRSGLTLKIKAAAWKGAPFLAFDPYQPPEGWDG